MAIDKLNIAVVGLGFMGATHLKAWQQVPNARIHAVIDTDPVKLSGDLSSVGGNLGDAGQPWDFAGIRGYRLLEEALADPAVDALDICLPTHEHAPAATAALRAGKHVLTEKPMALDAAAARLLAQEAKQSGRILMAAHVLRFFPAYQQLALTVKKSSPVRSAVFRRRCAAPHWSPWLTDPARSGGGIMDLLIHDADFCVSLWGMPHSVHARGHRDLRRGIDVVHADLVYPGLGPVIVTGGWHHPKSFPFSMEFTVVADAGTVEWSNGANDFREYSENGEARSIPLPQTDAFVAELSYFAQCAANGRQPDLCPPDQSTMAIALISKITESREMNGEVILC